MEKTTRVGRNVLIVEDETLLALMLQDLLLDIGHRVLHAGSVGEALELLAREKFDAAILDINLDGKDVFPVALRLRELGTPFVFASASRARVDSGFQDEALIPKPYTIGEVRQSLDRMLAS